MARITPTGVTTTRPGQSMATVRGGVQPGGGSATFGFGTPQAKQFLQLSGISQPDLNLPADIQKREMERAISFHKKNQEAVAAVQAREQKGRLDAFKIKADAFAAAIKNAPIDEATGQRLPNAFLDRLEADLGRDLQSIMGGGGGVPTGVPGDIGVPDPKTGKIVTVPGMVPEQFRGQAAGITPEQHETIRREGAGGPGGKSFFPGTPLVPPAPEVGAVPDIEPARKVTAVKATYKGKTVEVIGKKGDNLVIIDPSQPGKAPQEVSKASVKRKAQLGLDPIIQEGF